MAHFHMLGDFLVSEEFMWAWGFEFFSGVLSSKESPYSWVGQLWSAVNWCQLSPFPHFFLFYTDLLSPKSFTLPASFAIFSGFHYLECSPQSATVLFLFVSSPFLKALFKSHLLHSSHTIICLLWARCANKMYICIFSQSWNQSCQRIAVILICQRVNNQRKLKSNLVPGSWVARLAFSLRSSWLECLTPSCCFFLNSLD